MSALDGAYNENAQPDSLPGYTVNQADPGAVTSGDAPGSTIGDDVIATEPDLTQYQGALVATSSLPANVLAGLRDSVAAADKQAQHVAPSAPTGFNPLAEPGQPGQQPGQPGVTAPVNTVRPQVMSGFVAASLAWADDSLVDALRTAATNAGPQAALMAPTITVNTRTGVVKAGGATPVGRHSAPASALVHGSQGGKGRFARDAPWFFPTVNAWAIANPPPTPGPHNGTLPMEGPPT